MVETEYRLDTSARVTLDSSGNGAVTNVGPTQNGERWKIVIFSASGGAVAKLQVIRGNAFDVTRKLDGTDRADNDSSNTDIELRSGEHISFWWTNGTAGAGMVCSIYGQRFVRGRRAY